MSTPTLLSISERLPLLEYFDLGLQILDRLDQKRNQEFVTNGLVTILTIGHDIREDLLDLLGNDAGVVLTNEVSIDIAVICQVRLIPVVDNAIDLRDALQSSLDLPNVRLEALVR